MLVKAMTQKAIKIKITVGGGARAQKERELTDNVSEEIVIRPNYQGISVILLAGTLLFGGGWLIFSSSETSPQPVESAINLVSESSPATAVISKDIAVPDENTVIAAEKKAPPLAEPQEEQIIPLNQEPLREEIIATHPAHPIDSIEPDTNEHVARAQFTSGILKREPVDNVRQLSLADKEHDSVKLYFFSELKGLKGKTVTHRWLFEDKEVARVKFRVGSDRWRVYSSKNIQIRKEGAWFVTINDDQGNVLHRTSIQAKEAPIFDSMIGR
jgi:hypothetical protein